MRDMIGIDEYRVKSDASIPRVSKPIVTKTLVADVQIFVIMFLQVQHKNNQVLIVIEKNSKWMKFLPLCSLKWLLEPERRRPSATRWRALSVHLSAFIIVASQILSLHHGIASNIIPFSNFHLSVFTSARLEILTTRAAVT
jgi:hypothetical protein